MSPEEALAVARTDAITNEQIQPLLLSVGSWHLWGCVVRGVTEVPRALSPGWWSQVRERVALVFAEAYDQESFVFWRRSD